MPRFAYRAKDHSLRLSEGTIEADNEAAAISRLGSQGLFPISITLSGTTVSGSPVVSPRPLVSPRRVSPRTLAYTTRQLADLIGGGLPLLSALMLLTKQTEHRGLQGVIDALAAAVRDGRSFSESLADHPQVFPPLYISMVKAGEVGGGLEQVLVRLAEIGEHEADVRSRLWSASAYPLFVLGVALMMTVFLLGYVIPTLSTVFIESGQTLPLPTRILLEISRFVRQWWWALLGLLTALGLVLRRWHARPSGRVMIDRLLMGLPGIGTLVRKLDTARLTRSLGVMAGQGVPVLQALDVVSSNVSNALVQRAVTQVHDAVRDGSSLAAALGATKQFPPFVGNMVAVGEESGTLDAALLKVATSYEREVDRAIRTLTTILEPVLLVLVGGIVMFIVLAMLLPIFQIGLGVQ